MEYRAILADSLTALKGQRRLKMAHTKGQMKVSFDGFVCWNVEDEKGIFLARFDKKEDAYLFASAPELLEACKSALQRLNEISDGEGLDSPYDIEILEKAISRAEGKE